MTLAALLTLALSFGFGLGVAVARRWASRSAWEQGIRAGRLMERCVMVGPLGRPARTFPERANRG